MASIQIKDLRTTALTVLKSAILTQVERYVEEKNPQLVGEIQAGNFHKIMLYLALYKDITHCSYRFLHTNVQFPFRIGQQSICTKVQRIRKVLSKWGTSKVQLGDAAAWTTAARHHKFPDSLADVNLWIDPTDILITNAPDRDAKSDYWSGKEKHPAWRFMAVCDGKGRVRKLWGGDFPSTHDNSFMTSHHAEVEELFNGGVIVGDTHFSACTKSFTNPKFFTPKAIRPPKKSKKKARTRRSRIRY